MKAWINGEFTGWDNATVPILSHSFGRGSAIFEVVDIVTTASGPAFFGLTEHIDRMYNTADLTFMTLPLTKDELTEAILSTARENNVKSGVCKFFAYYPLIEFNAVPQNPQVDVAVFCVDYDAYNIKQEELSKPVTVGISSFRKLHPDTVPVHAKVVGNYVSFFLAKMEMKKAGYDDVIMLDTRGYIAEGATSNVFFVRGGKLVTPTLDNILPGVTRRAVLTIARDTGYNVSETDISPEDLSDMDEAFFCGSLAKILPIKSIDGKAIGKACPGPVTCDLKERLTDMFSGKIPQYTDWLTHI
ncbi:MAG: branched-chain-amino-acid transaminase [Deltaproteobacteria bacterium]|nr:branched-chain-amino-acid transaminase [Candidatus Zymogenaceae bacterium]